MQGEGIILLFKVLTMRVCIYIYRKRERESLCIPLANSSTYITNMAVVFGLEKKRKKKKIAQIF